MVSKTDRYAVVPVVVEHRHRGERELKYSKRLECTPKTVHPAVERREALACVMREVPHSYCN